jgi:class 3 adenylate cyclase
VEQARKGSDFGSARQALRAAVEPQERFIEETHKDPSLPLRVGIGLDAGEAMPFEGAYRGRALNLAARLKDQARAGQVLATEALIHQAGQMGGLAYVERGLVHAKGFALPVQCFRLRRRDSSYRK